VKRYEAHSGRVNVLCFDERAEHVASCSDDGSVVVRLAAMAKLECLFSCPFQHLLPVKIETRPPPNCHQEANATFAQVTGLYTDAVVKSKHRDAITVCLLLIRRLQRARCCGLIKSVSVRNVGSASTSPNLSMSILK
jgi:hypothetical protein